MTNVLIVDDEKIEREGLKYLLSREEGERNVFDCLLYTSPSPRDPKTSRMPSSA